MKIHLVSDVHLEAWRSASGVIQGFFNEVAGKVDLIVLAGDIAPVWQYPSAYREFIQAAKKAAPNVVAVLGNHEYYHSVWEETFQIANAICEEESAYLLDIQGRAEITIDGVKIWGSTLWTDLGNNDPIISKAVEYNLSDYALIMKERGELKQHGMLHAEDTYGEFLRTKEMINFEADLIITHHCPLGFAHSRFPYNEVSHGFNCYDKELENRILESKNNKYWLYGHTHDNRREEIAGTKFISNCVGYPREPNVQYDSGLIIEI